MEFTLDKQELSQLSTLVKMSQSVSDVSVHPSSFMFKVEEDKLNVAIYGNGNVIQFFVNISNVIKEPDECSYFNTDVKQFIQAFEKVYAASLQDEAVAKIEAQKITVKNGKSKIAVALLNVLSEDELKEGFDAYDEKKKSQFTSEEADYALITSEVVDFMDTVGKFINMIGPDRVSGLSLKNNKILYSDQAFSIVDKTCLDKLTNGTVAYLPQSLFAFLGAIQKVEDQFTLVYSDDKRMVNIDLPTINFKAIVLFPETLCEFPDNETLQMICPSQDKKIEFDVDIDTFKMKMNMFDGVFPSSQWRWKTIEFFINAEEKTVNMRYNNMCAEVDTDLPIESINLTNITENYSMRLASVLLYDYLNKLSGDSQSVHVVLSPLGTQEEHGMGVIFKLDNMILVLSKLEEAEDF